MEGIVERDSRELSKCDRRGGGPMRHTPSRRIDEGVQRPNGRKENGWKFVCWTI